MRLRDSNCCTALRIAKVVALLGALSCSDTSVFDPPDATVVGQTLGALLAVSYAASLTHHALDGEDGPCHRRLIANTTGAAS